MPPALPNQLEQTAPGMLVVLVELEVFYKMVDAGGQQRDLHLWRTGIRDMAMVFLDYRVFLVFA